MKRRFWWILIYGAIPWLVVAVIFTSWLRWFA